MTDITLYGYYTSPYVQKVRCYLDYKQLRYAHVAVRPVSNEEIRFTGQKRVPVLKIDDEWRLESSSIGHWLDERFPDRALLPADADARAHILAIDDWISDIFIPARFREAVDWDRPVNSIRNGWRLAAIVNSATPIPPHWRLLWPFFVRKAPFIVAMMADIDRSEPMPAMRARLAAELSTRLEGGPYLGGQPAPTLADLSVFPILAFSWMAGFAGRPAWRDRDELVDYARRVAGHLPDNPTPAPERFITRRL